MLRALRKNGRPFFSSFLIFRDFHLVSNGKTTDISRIIKYPIPYRKMDKCGFSTAEKLILIDCIYDEVIYPFSAENFDLALVEIAGKYCCKSSRDMPDINPFVHERRGR